MDEMTRRKMWVVEIYLSRRWQPTVGVALTKRTGREVLAHWKGNLPDDKVRLRPYQAVTR